MVSRGDDGFDADFAIAFGFGDDLCSGGIVLFLFLGSADLLFSFLVSDLFALCFADDLDLGELTIGLCGLHQLVFVTDLDLLALLDRLNRQCCLRTRFDSPVGGGSFKACALLVRSIGIHSPDLKGAGAR